jgi:hypothetical protein
MKYSFRYWLCLPEILLLTLVFSCKKEEVHISPLIYFQNKTNSLDTVISINDTLNAIVYADKGSADLKILRANSTSNVSGIIINTSGSDTLSSAEFSHVERSFGFASNQPGSLTIQFIIYDFDGDSASANVIVNVQ